MTKIPPIVPSSNLDSSYLPAAKYAICSIFSWKAFSIFLKALLHSGHDRHVLKQNFILFPKRQNGQFGHFRHDIRDTTENHPWWTFWTWQTCFEKTSIFFPKMTKWTFWTWHKRPYRLWPGMDILGMTDTIFKLLKKFLCSIHVMFFSCMIAWKRTLR